MVRRSDERGMLQYLAEGGGVAGEAADHGHRRRHVPAGDQQAPGHSYGEELIQHRRYLLKYFRYRRHKNFSKIIPRSTLGIYRHMILSIKLFHHKETLSIQSSISSQALSLHKQYM